MGVKALRLAAIATALWLIFPASLAWADCSYDLNGVGYGDNCPYRGGGGYIYHPPIYYPPRPPVYYPPPPPPPSPAQIRAQQLLNQAHNANQAGVAASFKNQWVAAMNDYRRALALSPNDPVIRQNLQKAEAAVAVQTNNVGIALQKRGDLAAAVADLRRAAALDPGNAIIKGNLQAALNSLEEQQRLAAAGQRIAPILDASAPATPDAAAGGLNFMGAPPAVDPIAGAEPPVPDLASLKWSASFPSGSAAAAVDVTRSDLDKLAAAGGASRDWLGANLTQAIKDKAKDAGVDHAIEMLPLSSALKDETHWQEGMVERYKNLFQDVNKDTQNYLLGFARVTNQTAACLGSAAASCGAEAADVQVVSNRYADQSSNRWKSWVSDDMKAHLSRFFNGSSQ